MRFFDFIEIIINIKAINTSLNTVNNDINKSLERIKEIIDPMLMFLMDRRYIELALYL